MLLSSPRSRIIAAVCAVLFLTTVATADAASLPTIGTRLYWVLGSFLHGGMIAPASTTLDTTALAGNVTVLPEFANATTLKNVSNSTASARPYKAVFNAYVRGTGSTTLRYGASCFPNPFRNMGGGSGSTLRIDYHNLASPAAIGGDIGFVKSCTGHAAGDNTASGDTIINNVCTATGCLSSFVSGSGANSFRPWNNVDYMKFTPRGNLTSGYQGRITGEVIKY